MYAYPGALLGLFMQTLSLETLANYAMIDAIMSKPHNWQFLSLQASYC